MMKRIIYTIWACIIIFLVNSCKQKSNLIINNEGNQIISPEETSETDPTSEKTLKTELTPTITLTSTPTLTPTPIPTFTIEEREAYVTELLKTNMGCDLPCWWGFTPGQSKWVDVEAFILDIGGITVSKEYEDWIGHGIGGLDFTSRSIYNVIGFYERGGVVEHIIIDAQAYNSTYASEFKKIWREYSPENIIKTYGQPSRVWVEIYVIRHQLDEVSYFIWIFYDHLGFLARYHGVASSEFPIHICPSYGQSDQLINSVKIYIKNISDELPLEELSDMEYRTAAVFHSIEDAAGISTEEFANLYINDNAPPCFDVIE